MRPVVLTTRVLSNLPKNFPGNRATKLLDWFPYSENTIDGQSKKKAYELFESGILAKLEPGSVKCLQQIHAYIFGGSTILLGKYAIKILGSIIKKILCRFMFMQL